MRQKRCHKKQREKEQKNQGKAREKKTRRKQRDYLQFFEKDQKHFE